MKAVNIVMVFIDLQRFEMRREKKKHSRMIVQYLSGLGRLKIKTRNTGIVSEQYY